MADKSTIDSQPDYQILDQRESFPQLSSAPIVEAVLQFKANSTLEVIRPELQSDLEEMLQDYTYKISEHHLSGGITFEKGEKTDVDFSSKLRGFRFESEPNKRVSQFLQDCFVFSQLEPYSDWTTFRDEALRLWVIHCKVLNPDSIQQVGMRFINRIGVPEGDCMLGEYLINAPHVPNNLNLPFEGFIHDEKLAVPEHPYTIRIIKTIQPSKSNSLQSAGIILDIDIHCSDIMKNTSEKLNQHLENMRLLKNKVFFGSITPQVIEGMK